MNGYLRTVGASFVAFALAGCAGHEPKPGAPEYAPRMPVVMEMPQPQVTGSIYQAGHDVRLFEDHKAGRVGDILVVNLAEKTDASKKADTDIAKQNDTAIANPTLLGLPVELGGAGKLPLQSGALSLGFNLGSDNSFKGEAESVQGNSLDGSIAVTVAAVLPNGNLVIQGEKWITLNQGDEYVQIRGIVRPDDIQPDNSVLSTQIADARITYSGVGAMNDANRMGWLARFFNGPYWPY